MACENCGKENNPDSKYCRFCGASLSKSVKTSFHVPKDFWKAPAFLVVVSVIAAGLLFWGGTRAYAYYQVQGKISAAEKQQQNGDYSGSVATLNGTSGYETTSGQAAKISAMKSDDVRFEGYESSFNEAVSEDSASSSDVLMKAQQQLQSISTDYPQYKSVQTELVKVQNEIVTALQAEAVANGESATEAKAQAEKNLQIANSAQAAKAQAESEAASAESDASANSATASTDTDNAFINQLTNIYNDYVNNCETYATDAVDDYSAGNTTGEAVYLGGAITACDSAETDSKALNNDYTNMPSDYVTAADDMEYAAYYMSQSLTDFSDGDYADAETEATDAEPYDAVVKADVGE